MENYNLQIFQVMISFLMQAVTIGVPTGAFICILWKPFEYLINRMRDSV